MSHFDDPFEEEAESIIASAEEAGHKVPPEKRDALRGEITEILNRAWDEGMDRVREVADEK